MVVIVVRGRSFRKIPDEIVQLRIDDQAFHDPGQEDGAVDSFESRQGSEVLVDRKETRLVNLETCCSYEYDLA